MNFGYNLKIQNDYLPGDQALSDKPHRKVQDWTDSMTEALTNTKEALAKVTILHHPVQGP